jgi:hypothetical protein
MDGFIVSSLVCNQKQGNHHSSAEELSFNEMRLQIRAERAGGYFNKDRYCKKCIASYNERLAKAKEKQA